MTYPARRFAPKTVRQDWNAVRQELEQVSDSIGIRIRAAYVKEPASGRCHAP